MATRPFPENDKAPEMWKLKGAYGTLSRTRGMFGFWYMLEQNKVPGGFEGWTLWVFEDHLKVPNYLGKPWYSSVFPQELRKNAAIKIEGSGGSYRGQGVALKVESVDGISFTKEIKAASLADGDEFLLNVIGLEAVSLEALDVWKEELRSKLHLAWQEDCAREAARNNKWRRRWAQERQGILHYEDVFASVASPEWLPPHHVGAVGLHGYSVWFENHGNRHYKTTLTTLEEFHDWREAVLIKQFIQNCKNLMDKKEQIAREAKQETQNQKDQAAMSILKAALGKLDL